MKKISVVLAVHNEAHNLERCLKSFSDFADEIIVVDGESSDGTPALAKKLGAKLISTTNKTNFHVNKQMAMDAAKGEVILQMDADEVVDEECGKFIREVAAGKNDDHDSVAWWIRRKNWFMGRFLKKGGQYPDPAIRLYLAGKAHLPAKDVHEFMSVDGPVGTAKGHLLHYGNPSFAEYLRKFNTYTSFKADQLKEQQVKITFLNSLKYLCWKPTATFISIFIRHRGYIDGVPGLVFAIFSGLHHSIAYLKLWEKLRT